jgi:hypothetical protein
MTPNLELFLAKLQAVLGTPEAALTAADDLLCCTPESKVEVVPAFEDTETVQANLGNDKATRGMVNASANIGMFIKSTGTTTGLVPSIHKLAQACGMIVEIVPCVGSTFKYKYRPAINPSSTVPPKDLTIWKFGGVGIGVQTTILKVGNIQGNWKISGKTGSKVKFELTDGKGIFVNEDVAGIMVDASAYINNMAVPAALPLTVLINNIAYNVTEFSFEGGNTVDQYPKCSEDNGYGISEITKKKGKFDFTAVSDAIGAMPPRLDMLNGEIIQPISLGFGGTGGVLLEVASPLYKDVKDESSGNISVWKVSGDMVYNDFLMTINKELVPV